MRRLRFAVVVLTVAALAFLAACGGSGGTNQGDTTGHEATMTAGHQAAATASAAMAPGFPVLVPAALPDGVSVSPPEFGETDNGIPTVRITGVRDDGQEAFVLDEQALVHGDGSGPTIEQNATVHAQPAQTFEGPPAIVSWVEHSLWITLRSDTMSVYDLLARAESTVLR